MSVARLRRDGLPLLRRRVLPLSLGRYRRLLSNGVLINFAWRCAASLKVLPELLQRELVGVVSLGEARLLF